MSVSSNILGLFLDVLHMDIHARHKPVLMAVIRYTSQGGNLCRKPLKDIADLAGCSEDTARSSLKYLVKEGILVFESTSNRKTYAVDEVRVANSSDVLTGAQGKDKAWRKQRDFPTVSTHPGKLPPSENTTLANSEGTLAICHPTLVNSQGALANSQGKGASEPTAPTVCDALIKSSIECSIKSSINPADVPPPGDLSEDEFRLSFEEASPWVEEEHEAQVLNGKGPAESVSTPAPIEAPHPERRPMPKPAIQDQPEQLTLTSPVGKPESAKKAPKFALKMPTEATPRDADEKAEIEAIARVYAHYVERMSSPGMMEPSGARKKREEHIRWWLRHPEFQESDLIAAIDGCLGDDWRVSKGQTSLIKYILRDEDSIHMFKAKAKKALTRSVRPTEYRNKRPNREQMLHHARLVASGTSSKHTLEGMCRYYSISEEEAQTMIDEAQAKYSHLPNYGLPTHAGWGQ